MKKIAIYGKPVPNPLNVEIAKLIELMQGYGFAVSVYTKFARHLRAQDLLPPDLDSFSKSQLSQKDFAFLTSIGGDGTLLDTLMLVGESGIPVIGINAGRLGFISSATMEEMEQVCASFVDGSYRCENRALLELQKQGNQFSGFNYALNEVTVLKKDSAAMVRIDVWLNEEFLNSYWADGLIVSTPTGSTAYSLSCGGPIVMPGSDNFVITPIAPHHLNVRPVVVSQDDSIRIRVSGRSDSFLLALDSRPSEIRESDEIIVKRAPFDFKLIQPEGHSFLNTLRNKMGWGFDKRN